MLLRKESGGTTHKWRGAEYAWPADDPVCDVPPELAEELLSIRGAGYSEAPAPEPEQEEDGTEEDGTEPAAPPKPAQRRKAAAAKAPPEGPEGA